MKELLLFIGGLITGIIITLIVAFFIGQAALAEQQTTGERVDLNMVMFDKPGDVANCKSYKVFNVIDDHRALVNGNLHYEWYDGPVYLIINDEGKFYYDDEIIKVSKGQVMRQVGIFHYETVVNKKKTVPIIKIMSK